MFPAGYLKVVGFFDQPDEEWYEGIHAPDFLSFAAPHMARYARNWVRGVKFGSEPNFHVITEIQFASESAKDMVRALMSTPAAGPLLEHTMSQRARRGIVDDAPAPGLGLFPVTPAPADPRPEGSLGSRQVLLLRRVNGASQAEFEAAAKAVAMEVGSQGGDIAASLDLLGTGEPSSPADAMIYVAKVGDASLPFTGRPELDLTGILDVETLSSAVGSGLVD